MVYTKEEQEAKLEEITRILLSSINPSLGVLHKVLGRDKFLEVVQNLERQNLVIPTMDEITQTYEDAILLFQANLLHLSPKDIRKSNPTVNLQRYNSLVKKVGNEIDLLENNKIKN